MSLLGSLASLPRRTAAYQEDESRPQRVRIPDFSIILSPASQISSDGASQAIQIAEGLMLKSLESYDFGINTTYDYAGLLGVEDVTQTMNSTSILVLGGLVVFTSNSTVIPSIEEIEEIMNEAWMPELAEALQMTSTFQHVSEIDYEHTMATFPPTLWPTFSPTYTASSDPTYQLEPSKKESEVIPILLAPKTESKNPMPVIGAGAAGVFLIVSLLALLLHRRRRKAYWRESNGSHKYPENDDVEASLEKDNPGKNDVESESGSSRFGRILARTGLTHSFLSDGRSTPQSSADSLEDMSDFDTSVTMIEPHIIPVSTRIQEELSRMPSPLEKDRLPPSEPSPTEYYPFWKSAPLSCHAETSSTDISPATIRKRTTILWSDVSSEHSDGNQKDFAPDLSWDFNDNEDDADSDVILDPFYTTDSVTDERNLLESPSQSYRMTRVMSKGSIK